MLDPRLVADSLFVMNLEAAQLRMLKDGENEWFLIIPSKQNCVEIIDLTESEQIVLMRNVNLISKVIKTYTKCDKLNVATLGNMVKQLHVHVIARYESDRAWPNAIWGTQSNKKFDAENVEVWKQRFNNAMEKN